VVGIRVPRELGEKPRKERAEKLVREVEEFRARLKPLIREDRGA